MFLILPWRDTESVKPCLSKEKVNEWCGICIGWQGNQGQVETWKSWEACEGGEGAGAAGCTMQRHLSPSSRKFPLCWWEPHGGTSAAAALPLAFCCCRLCGINKPSLSPELLLFWLILRRDQHGFVLDDDEPEKAPCATQMLSWGLPTGISAVGGGTAV